VNTYAIPGPTFGLWLQAVEILGINTELERDRIAFELGKLFDP
jgi:hypothetical protein